MGVTDSRVHVNPLVAAMANNHTVLHAVPTAVFAQLPVVDVLSTSSATSVWDHDFTNAACTLVQAHGGALGEFLSHHSPRPATAYMLRTEAPTDCMARSSLSRALERLSAYL